MPWEWSPSTEDERAIPSTFQAARTATPWSSPARSCPPTRVMPEWRWKESQRCPSACLGLRRRPYFDDQTLTGLQPRDRFTLWVVLRPPEPMANGKYNLTFYDTATEKSVLQIPVIFGGEEGHHHEG